jgi:hypothetical protein
MVPGGSQAQPQAQQFTQISDDPKTILKKLVDNIPTKKATLFAYVVDWPTIDKFDIVQSVMRPWIVKKIIEYLGNK